MIKRIWLWLIYSSKDPSKISTMIKGGVAFLVTLLTFWATATHIPFSGDDVKALGDNLITVIQGIALVITTLVTLFGGIRKLWVTFTGEHPMGRIF